MEEYKLLIDGKEVDCNTVKVINSPYDGKGIAAVHFGGSEKLALSVKSAQQAFDVTRRLPVYKRVEILTRAADLLEQKQGELADIICAEAGKPITYAKGEAARAVDTFRATADILKSGAGELVPIDSVAAGEGRYGLVRRFPIGPIAAISPFNFPLNLVCHKVAPAIAAGNTIVLKPASQTPISALKLGQIIHEAGYPAGGINVIPCPGSVAEDLTVDPLVRAITFTGSAEIGWRLKQKAYKKKVTLELGGNAAVLVDKDIDPGKIAKRLVIGSFAYSGQICISIQRIYIEKPLYQRFVEVFLDAVREYGISGDPREENVVAGPMISSDDADRVQSWVQEALDNGARLLCGNQRDNQVISPVVLDNVDPKDKVSWQEVFGPVVVLDSFETWDEGIAKVNDSIFGLQAGVYTNDIARLMQAFERIEVGGVIHNDYPTFRVDLMPYGGVKESGFGREGPRYAYQEMTEQRLLVLKPNQ